VQFGNSSTSEYTANLIAENLYAQCDPEGHCQLVFKEITDHRKGPTALRKDQGYVIGYNGNRHMKRTMKGWDICLEWRDGTTSWLPLKDMKEANPLELAEYAVANKLEEEPAFAWWVPDTLRQRNRIISKLKTKYWRTLHKFGIKIPKSVEHALQIDWEMGTNHW